jgi:hypothetical protein
MAESQYQCPLCDINIDPPAQIPSIRLSKYKCPRCGYYAIYETYASSIREACPDTYKLSSIIREHTLRHPDSNSVLLLLFSIEQAGSGITGYDKVIASDLVNNRYPTRVPDRIDRSLLNLSYLSKLEGETIVLQPETDRTIFYSQNNDQADFIIGALQHYQWITFRGRTTSGIHLKISPDGWRRIAELEDAQYGQQSSTGFVAMWYGDVRKDYNGEYTPAYMLRVYEDGLSKGISMAGYKPCRIDMIEFNDDIVAEIKAQIRQSRFVVADFTGQRNGVYFESGYAQGLGLHVIHTCRNDDLDNTHFDTRNYNAIVWENLEDLAKRVKNRIIAKIGKGPHAMDDDRS